MLILILQEICWNRTTSLKINIYEHLQHITHTSHRFSLSLCINVFLPLLQTSMVILPLIFKLCDFTLIIFKRSCRLPLVNAFLPLF